MPPPPGLSATLFNVIASIENEKGPAITDRRAFMH
jgi:hypothetical protein